MLSHLILANTKINTRKTVLRLNNLILMIRSINFSPLNLLFWRIWNFLEPECWGSTKAKNYVVKNKRNVLRNEFTCFGPLFALKGLTCTFSENNYCVIMLAQEFNSRNPSFLRSWLVGAIWDCSTWFQGKGQKQSAVAKRPGDLLTSEKLREQFVMRFERIVM